VKNIVSRKGMALEYASIDLRADREIVLIAVSQAIYYNLDPLQFASKELQTDKEIIEIAASHYVRH